MEVGVGIQSSLEIAKFDSNTTTDVLESNREGSARGNRWGDFFRLLRSSGWRHVCRGSQDNATAKLEPIRPRFHNKHHRLAKTHAMIRLYMLGGSSMTKWTARVGDRNDKLKQPQDLE